MVNPEPPDLSGVKLDFSRYHPLDHWPATSYCRTLPGGWRNHVALAWEYRWRDRLGRALLCRVGRHAMADGWQREDPLSPWRTFRSCIRCGEPG